MPNTKFSLMLKVIRPKQWTKNLLVLAAPFASTKLLSNFPTIIFSIMGFICASIIGYLLNDWQDRQRDRLHDKKQNRPFATGELKFMDLLVMLLVLSLGVFITCLVVGETLAQMLVLYLVVSISYTFMFKNIPVLEMFWLAFGFLIRALAGSFILRETPTGWFVITIFFGSLFLTSCKRLSEKGNQNSEFTRRVLSSYSYGFLEAVSTTFAGITAIMYSLWVVQEHSTSFFAYGSILFFSCALFSYLLTSFGSQTEEPESALFKNRIVLLMGSATILTLTWVFYS